MGNGRYDVEYVTLSPGEQVQILGSTEVALEDGQDLMCYEIAPPAGEFRWMRTRDISRDSPQDQLHAAPQGSDASDSWGAKTDELVNFADDGIPLTSMQSSHVDHASSIDDRQSEVQGVQLTQFTADPDSRAKPPMPAESLGLIDPPSRQLDRPTADVADERRSPDGLPYRGFSSESLLPAMRSISSSPQPLELGPIGKLRLGQELIDIELQLTKQVCQSPATWHLSDLRTRAQAVIDASHDPRQRATAQHIIAKIAQFEDVRRRQKTIVSSNFDRTAPERQLVSQGTARAGEPAYDGTGFLMPVVTQDPNIPKYVLTDEQGNIVQFVSPKPGISLKRYEQQRVGILGERGYLPTYNQPHLMAERIITLEKTR